MRRRISFIANDITIISERPGGNLTTDERRLDR